MSKHEPKLVPASSLKPNDEIQLNRGKATIINVSINNEDDGVVSTSLVTVLFVFNRNVTKDGDYEKKEFVKMTCYTTDGAEAYLLLLPSPKKRWYKW